MNEATDPKRPRLAARAGLLLALLAATALVAHARGRIAAPSGGVPAPTPTPPHATVAPAGAARVEVAFVLDTTGSMSGLIEGAKRKIWSIANQLASAEQKASVRVALVAYRDRGDDYVTRRFDLTDDVDGIYAALRQQRAQGGGDGPESVNQALNEAVTRLSWSRDPAVYRVIFLVGDAPPHMDYRNDVPFEQSVRLARQRGIAVNTIQCGSAQQTAAVWRRIAALGAGQYAAIPQDGGMVATTTPMDGELSRLSRELAGTVVAYGSAERQRDLRAKLDLAAEAPAPASADRLAYLSKVGGRVVSGASDLLDAVKAGLSLDDVAEKELPPKLRAMKPAARRVFVEKKLEQRAAIQGRIDALSSERDAWLARENERLEAEGRGDGFDRKVLETIRGQAAAKGIAY